MKKIYLASTSPRRAELLRQVDVDFEIIAPQCDENIKADFPHELVESLSLRKCTAGADMIRKNDKKACGIVIGADTVVALNNKVLGKPCSQKEACSMLRQLSGITHYVYTGVSAMDLETGNVTTFYEKTDVTFYDLSDEEIDYYVSTGEPMDKAGAYGIQGKGAFLVRKITGDYCNVVGLPVAHLVRILKNM